MQKLAALFVITSTLFTGLAQASVHGVERATFNCSNGKTYDVATYYSGGWGPSTRKLLGICSQGTLEHKFYGWRFDVPAAQTCMAETGADLESCYYELIGLNPIDKEKYFTSPEFTGNVEKIIQGR